MKIRRLALNKLYDCIILQLTAPKIPVFVWSHQQNSLIIVSKMLFQIWFKWGEGGTFKIFIYRIPHHRALETNTEYSLWYWQRIQQISRKNNKCRVQWECVVIKLTELAFDIWYLHVSTRKSISDIEAYDALRIDTFRSFSLFVFFTKTLIDL